MRTEPTSGLSILDVQIIEGAENAYRNISNVSGNSSGSLFTTTTGAVPLTLTYSPPVDAWWDVTAHVGIFQNADTVAWRYMYAALILSPAPAYGSAAAYAISTQVAPASFDHREVQKLYALEAGETYQVSAQYAGDAAGGTWSYYCGSAYLWIQGIAYERL
jgi:hypothetical protein